jgi:hypothetical protein
MRQWASIAGFLILPTVSLFARQRGARGSGKIVLETAPAAGMVPVLPHESKSEPEPASRILPQPDQDRTLAQAIAHYRTVPHPDGTVNGDEDPLDYADQFREFEAESRRLGVLFDGLKPQFEGGREHDLIFDMETGTVLKFTKPSRAGYEVEFDSGRPNLVPGLPLGYLKRLALHNEVFADSISFVGMGGDFPQRRIITRQELIEGRPASWEEITRMMVDELGYAKLRHNHGIGYDDSYAFVRGEVAVFDLRPANVFVTDSGVMVTIDSIPVRITDDQRMMLLGK